MTDLRQIDRFQKNIEKYYNNHKELEYLDLATPDLEIIIIEEGIEVPCLKKEFSHQYHSKKPQLNYISDISLANNRNIAVIYDRLGLGNKIFIKHFYSLHAQIDNLEKIFEKKF